MKSEDACDRVVRKGGGSSKELFVKGAYMGRRRVLRTGSVKPTYSTALLVEHGMNSREARRVVASS